MRLTGFFFNVFLKPISLRSQLLLQKSKDIPFDKIQSSEIQELCQNMIYTSENLGRTGAAAVQFGFLKNLFIFSVKPKEEADPRYYSIYSENEVSKPWTVAINPKFTPLESTCIKKAKEVCISVPGTGEVERFDKILASYYDQDGQLITEILSGMSSRIFQHEYDHTKGILFPMRMAKNTEMEIEAMDYIY